ncbi:MAG: GNAT family N-acetyltransferase [Actinobacteria bacterium]|nr:MAG: GNAT family N-acetyltransferase [Actinomycetota bacterium]
MGEWEIRRGAVGDLEAVLDLWRRSCALPTVTDDVESLRALLLADAGALLVAEVPAEGASARAAVVGSLIAAWNGWRGSFYRLAVDPDHRRRGIGRRLVREGEKRLRERGAGRLDAIVAADEADAAGFWEALGYERQRDRVRFVRNF